MTDGTPIPITEERIVDNSAQISQGRDRVLAIMTRANDVFRLADLSSMVQEMLDLMMQITLADSANFFQLDPVTDELVITHIRGDGVSQQLVGMRLNRQQGLPGLSAYDARIVVVGDLPSEPDWLRVVDPASAAQKHNLINLPVVNQGRTLGVIQLFNYQQAELDLLMVLGDRLAIEMERRKEIDATCKSNQRLLTLVDMLGEVAGTLDRNRLLHLVTESASRLVGAERSSIFLVDPSTREMIYHVAYQSPEQITSKGPMEAMDRASMNRESDAPIKSAIGTKKNSTSFQSGEFSYFNRSAITVPIKNGPAGRSLADGSSSDGDLPDDHRRVLGGLMALNNQSAVFQEEDAQLLTILAEQASTFLQVAEMYESTGDLFLGVIKALATAIDAKDPYTQNHSQRVSDFSVLIARELGLDEKAVNDIRIGSLFHDIGKIGIPDDILLRNGKLSEAEIEVMKQHPRLGVNILGQVKLLEPMLPAILEHHERLDGSGYPAKLTDKHISWMGRIVAVADVYDAMTSDRPYRAAQSTRSVLSFLHEKAGILFDAECVQALDRILARPTQFETGLGSLNGDPIL